MSGGTRLLLFIYNIVLLLIAVLVIAVAAGEINLAYGLQVAVSTTQNRFMLGICGVIICILSLMGIVKAFSSSNKKVQSVPIEGSQIGNIQITFTAITVIIMMAVKKIQGVKEVRPKVVNTESGLVVKLHMMINPEYSVPTMSMDIQNIVKAHLEDIGGVKVAAIQVLVDNFTVPAKTSQS